MTEEQLELAVQVAEQKLSEAVNALSAFRSTAEYHTYETLDYALAEIEDYLYNQADKDCEGSYNCGLDSYSQDFTVDGVVYTATMTFEYNRHDKTYYYIEESEFSYSEKH